ncbi:MAG: type II toxin-antitoxin system HigB family toxin [Cyanobacteria bacterium SZAS TMP-1]|nr:type II toxin-antitoxin system HigB family toxin [Cyanobacteria bacterium SZAS TMP-1]
MRVLGKERLEQFAKANAGSRSALAAWEVVVRQSTATNFTELRQTFSTVSYVPQDRYCFNIGGNKFRLIASISFILQVVTIQEVMTHATYSKWVDHRK